MNSLQPINLHRRIGNLLALFVYILDVNVLVIPSIFCTLSEIFYICGDKQAHLCQLLIDL